MMMACTPFAKAGAQAVDTNGQLSMVNVQSTKWKPFNSMDLGVSIGTTGLGIEVSAPVVSFAKLRTGFHYLPGFEVPMSFGIQVGDDPSTSKSKFDKLQGMLKGFTGYDVDDKIEMKGKPANFWNWNVLVDIYPLKNNKHWHLTGGFYLGPSRIAKAYNSTEDMPSLMAVGMYNSMYNKMINDRIAACPDLLYEVKLIDLSSLGDGYSLSNDPRMLEMMQKLFKDAGRMGVHVGDYTHDIYYPEDVYVNIPDDDGNEVATKVHSKGDIMHKKGDPYIMEIDEDGMVRADMKVKNFKPYVGIGYEGSLSRRTDRNKIAVDCGVLFWGGSPDVRTHEGVDLIHDVENIGGKVGRYVDTVDKFKVYPVISIRFTSRLF